MSDYMPDKMSEYTCIHLPIYAMLTSRWYVRNYVRIVCQEGPILQQSHCQSDIQYIPVPYILSNALRAHLPSGHIYGELRFSRGYCIQTTSFCIRKLPKTIENLTLGPRAVDEVALFCIIWGSFCNGRATWANIYGSNRRIPRAEVGWSCSMTSPWFMITKPYKINQNHTKSLCKDIEKATCWKPISHGISPFPSCVLNQ